ncbi:MAG: NUDIX domain-containing protein [Candidatus Izemoplasmatales bacterium]
MEEGGNMESYIAFIRSKVGNSKIMLNACSVVITNEADEVLLQHRTDNGLWGLPGGLMELDETIEECAIREVKEETNLDIELTKFLGVFVNPMMRWREVDEAQVFAFSFVGKVIGSTLRVNDQESSEFAYFDRFHLPKIHAIDNIQAIEAYYNHLEGLVEGVKY